MAHEYVVPRRLDRGPWPVIRRTAQLKNVQRGCPTRNATLRLQSVRDNSGLALFCASAFFRGQMFSVVARLGSSQTRRRFLCNDSQEYGERDSVERGKSRRRLAWKCAWKKWKTATAMSPSNLRWWISV